MNWFEQVRQFRSGASRWCVDTEDFAEVKWYEIIEDLVIIDKIKSNSM
jgi:hypothetical protein